MDDFLKPSPENNLSQKEQKMILEEKLGEMHELLKEGYHKECVKVYRNLQATFTEEREKGAKAVRTGMERIERLVRLAVILSALALAAGLGSLSLQALMMLKTLP